MSLFEFGEMVTMMLRVLLPCREVVAMVQNGVVPKDVRKVTYPLLPRNEFSNADQSSVVVQTHLHTYTCMYMHAKKHIVICMYLHKTRTRTK
jgi:hypothetical protein